MMARWQGPFTGRHMLALMLGFFAVVIAVNGAFIAFATGTWTGVEDEHPYLEGLAYNRVLEHAAAQRKLGWSAAIEREAAADGRTGIVARFADAQDRPLTDLVVSATLRRPIGEGFDREVELVPNAAGAYRAEVRLPLPGQWEVTVTARNRRGETFLARRRILSE